MLLDELCAWKERYIMALEIRYSTVKKMLEVIKKLRDGKNIRLELGILLEHPDYQVEFARYKGRVGKNEFIDYIVSLPTLKEEDISNHDLRMHHKYYEDLLENIDTYVEEAEKLKLLTIALFEEQIAITLDGLPDGFILPDVNFLFTLGIGQSFGWVYDNHSHFDFLQLVKDVSFDEFCKIIAHEVHHVAINKLFSHLDVASFSLEDMFYLYFAAEGLAVKYCNNAEGILSKSLKQERKNIGLDTFSWDYLNDVFEQHFQEFIQTVRDIREGKITSQEALNKRFQDFWMNPYTAKQNLDELPLLKQYPVYAMGNEIWGIIHDCYGKEVLYQTLKNIKKFPEVFNGAVYQLNRSDLKII